MAVAFVVAIFTVPGASGQKCTDGDKTLSFLRGVKSINIEYTYDSMFVGKKHEADYVSEKVAAYNKKQSGKGDRWAEKWVSNRASIYEPMFEELINKVLFKEKTGMTAGKDKSDAKYTLVVHTDMTEPGFNAVVMKVDPSCNFDFYWIEKESGKVMAKGYLDKVPGHVVFDSDYDFDPSNRIKECYAKVGKEVGKYIAKMRK